MTLKKMLTGFPYDGFKTPAAAMEMSADENEDGLHVHQHATGQLVLTLRGSVVCRVPETLWLVPPQSAVWLPPGTPHCNHMASDSRVCLLFVHAEHIELPSVCRALSVTPLVRELIRHVAALPQHAPSTEHTKMLMQVLLTELAGLPEISLHLPVSSDSRLQNIAEAIAESPDDRKTLAEWARYTGMSTRSLARLVVRDTGLSFGRWRQQLRLMIAIHRLSGGATVQQTAWSLGYESVTAFITMFKKAMGISPARYVFGNTEKIKDTDLQ